MSCPFGTNVSFVGGYTALSTKGVSSMLSSTLLGAFTTPVTYGLLLVLLSTAVMQVRYLNRALQRFDSTQVIPIQFVLFTLSVITGSAVLYRDFERTTAHQAVKFIGGCLLTFFGVFLITSGRPRHDEDEDALSDAEGVQETIGLAEQEHVQTPVHPSSRRGSESARSQRSSKASRANYVDTGNKPLTPLTETAIPTLRLPPSSSNQPSPSADGNEGAPLLTNPWGNSEPDHHRSTQHRKLPVSALSSDTIQTIHSAAISDTSIPPPPNIPDIHPETPRPPTSSRPHSHVFNMISPSPFSSTVSAVVADKLLPHLAPDSPSARRIGSRRSRPGLRNSLFVPQDELDDGDEIVSASAVEQRRLGQHSDEESEVHRGFRTRARSLSNTLGELLGVSRRKVRVTDGDAAEEEEPFITRSQSHSGTGVAVGGSGETV